MNRLIERTTPHLADRFVLETIEKQNGRDLYEIETENGKIVLRASSDSALAAGYYRYLRECCGMDLSPCGNTEVYASGEPRVPEKKIVQVLRYDLRLAMDYDVYAHDAYAWDWTRWERELDFLAMQGVNAAYMPVGQEAVWYYAALDLEIKREDAMVFLANPCYYPLQLAGKLDSFFSMTDTNFLKAQIALGQQIITRMREVGIEPILPAARACGRDRVRISSRPATASRSHTASIRTTRCSGKSPARCRNGRRTTSARQNTTWRSRSSTCIRASRTSVSFPKPETRSWPRSAARHRTVSGCSTRANIRPSSRAASRGTAC